MYIIYMFIPSSYFMNFLPYVIDMPSFLSLLIFIVGKQRRQQTRLLIYVLYLKVNDYF